MTLLDTLDSVVKIGLGAAIASFTDWRKRREERSSEARRLSRERFIEPIVAFFDEELDMISEFYWVSTDYQLGDPSQTNTDELKQRAAQAGAEAVRDKLFRVRNRQASIGARVRSLKHPELTEAFRQFNNQYFKTKATFVEGGFGAAKPELDKAADLATEMHSHLWGIGEATKSGPPGQGIPR